MIAGRQIVQYVLFQQMKGYGKMLLNSPHKCGYVEAIAGFIALGKTVAGGRVDIQPAAPCKLAPPKIGDDE